MLCSYLIRAAKFGGKYYLYVDAKKHAELCCTELNKGKTEVDVQTQAKNLKSAMLDGNGFKAEIKQGSASSKDSDANAD
jgi:hypothetical protein